MLSFRLTSGKWSKPEFHLPKGCIWIFLVISSVARRKLSQFVIFQSLEYLKPQ
jgi:hypothetical protein